MVIKAKIVDIRSTDPTGKFAFFVDTNAWYWMTYTRASTQGLQAPAKYQLEQYLRFMKKARDVGAGIYHCSLSFAELAHRIEATERQIFSIHRQGGMEMRAKDFRHIEAERANVISEIEGSWEQVKAMSESIPFEVDGNAVSEAMKILKKCGVDGYDAFHVHALLHGRLTSVLTDDADFATIPNILVLTSNIALLRRAEKEGHLEDGQQYFASKN